MGYVHDTAMSQFISPFECGKTAGTWTPTIASNVVSDVRTAAGAAFTVLIPVKVPSNGVALKGAYLQSIEIYYKIATAAATAFAATLNKMTLPASGSAVSGAAVDVTEDAGHDTEAECYAVGDHTMTLTLDSPAWVDDGECYYASLVITAAAGTVFSLFGAVANFTLRI